jgi:cytochrome b
VWDYAKNVRRASAERAVGHNPMGGWSVLAMLLTLAVQATTGLFANDDVMLEGPWASAVSKETSDFLTHVHKINSNVLVALVVLHVLAILYYAIVHRENLVKAMITGKKRLDVPLEPISARWGWAIAAIVIAASLTYFIVKK